MVVLGFGLEGHGLQRRSPLLLAHCERDWINEHGEAQYACPDSGCGGACPNWLEQDGYRYGLPDGDARKKFTTSAHPFLRVEQYDENWGERWSTEASIETTVSDTNPTGGVLIVGWEPVKESPRRQATCGMSRDNVLVLDPPGPCKSSAFKGYANGEDTALPRQICQDYYGLRIVGVQSQSFDQPSPAPPTPFPTVFV